MAVPPDEADAPALDASLDVDADALPLPPACPGVPEASAPVETLASEPLDEDEDVTVADAEPLGSVVVICGVGCGEEGGGVLGVSS